MDFNIGSPGEKIWLCIEKPSVSDYGAGEILSGSVGWEIKKWGLPLETYKTCITGNSNLQEFIAAVNNHKPAIIISLGEDTIKLLCPQVIRKGYENKETLGKWAGSLLKSPLLTYDHYVLGTYSPSELFAIWEERDIVKTIDIARAVEEYEYFMINGKLQPLPSRELIVDLDYAALIDFLQKLIIRHKGGLVPIISVDIETIRPRKNSPLFFRHPGCVYTIGIADGPDRAVSFILTDFDTEQLLEIYKLLKDIFNNIPQVGQNYFNFDVKFFEAMGFSMCLEKCSDTRIMHHLLWPSLSHSLQFLTRQYTREPYYKDEGKGYYPKSEASRRRFKMYNALDCCVTMEVYEREKEELLARDME